MFKWVLLLISVLFSTHTIASVDLDLACKEKKEQKMSLLATMSTSLREAHLAGQCTGYWSFDTISVKKSCSEYVEQKKALLSTLSTSISEAGLAGICIGVIYRVAQDCNLRVSTSRYLGIAENADSLDSIRESISCYGW